jgi:hypothetical protein
LFSEQVEARRATGLGVEGCLFVSADETIMIHEIANVTDTHLSPFPSVDGSARNPGVSRSTIKSSGAVTIRSSGRPPPGLVRTAAEDRRPAEAPEQRDERRTPPARGQVEAPFHA